MVSFGCGEGHVLCMVTHSSVCVSEHIEAAFGMLKFVRWKHGFVDLGDHIPKFGVLLVEDNDRAAGLGVEGARYVLDSLGDELLNAGVGNCGLVLKGVVGASMLDSFEEIHLAGHFGGR